MIKKLPIPLQLGLWKSAEALKERISEKRRRELALERHGVCGFIRRGKYITRPVDEDVNTGVKASNLDIWEQITGLFAQSLRVKLKLRKMEQTECY